MWIIAGLGNPGAKYELTRHNIGFLVIDALEKKYQGNFTKNFDGLSATIKINNSPCLLLKPQTFMNKSGSSVLSAQTFYKVALNNIIVMHDDLDLPIGELRIKQGGGHGGHNGLRDITAKSGADFIRIRIGIGRPEFKGSEADYVLSNFTNDEFVTLEEVIQSAIIAVETLISKDVATAQQLCQIKKI